MTTAPERAGATTAPVPEPPNGNCPKCSQKFEYCRCAPKGGRF
ncbi:hypothetical protein [Streptomyces macrosporus]